MNTFWQLCHYVTSTWRIIHNLDLTFVVLAVVPMGNNKLVLTQLIAEIWECDEMSWKG